MLSGAVRFRPLDIQGCDSRGKFRVQDDWNTRHERSRRLKKNLLWRYPGGPLLALPYLAEMLSAGVAALLFRCSVKRANWFSKNLGVHNLWRQEPNADRFENVRWRQFAALHEAVFREVAIGTANCHGTKRYVYTGHHYYCQPGLTLSGQYCEVRPAFLAGRSWLDDLDCCWVAGSAQEKSALR